MSADLPKEDLNDMCVCGHYRVCHYLRAGKYTDCGWCPHPDNTPQCPQFQSMEVKK